MERHIKYLLIGAVSLAAFWIGLGENPMLHLQATQPIEEKQYILLGANNRDAQYTEELCTVFDPAACQ